MLILAQCHHTSMVKSLLQMMAQRDPYGRYERFTDEPASQANNVTTRQVYAAVIGKERRENIWVVPSGNPSHHQ
jgi:hypothetical protein